MEAAAERAGAADIRLSSQRSLLTRRMLDEMGLRELEALIAEAARMGATRDEAWPTGWPRRARRLFAEASRYRRAAARSSTPPRPAGSCAKSCWPSRS